MYIGEHTSHVFYQENARSESVSVTDTSEGFGSVVMAKSEYIDTYSKHLSFQKFVDD